MPADTEHLSIERAIVAFAQAYEALDNLQAHEARKEAHTALLPPKGDQKTGLIGEYWAIRYARSAFPNATAEFGGHSQKGWDFKLLRKRSKPTYIQLKTASEFGNGKLSAICKPSKRRLAGEGEELPDYWDKLWLLWLDRRLMPVVLWMFKPEHVEFNGADCLKGKTLRRHPDERNTGSNCFKWDEAESVTAIFTGKGGK